MKLLKSRVFRIIAGVSLAVLIIAFIWVEINRNNTLNFDNRKTEADYCSFIDTAAEQAGCRYYAPYRSENGSRISLMSNDRGEVRGLYYNYTELDLSGSISSLLPYLNNMCGKDTEQQLKKLCRNLNIDYNCCSIGEIGKGRLEEILCSICDEGAN